MLHLIGSEPSPVDRISASTANAIAFLPLAAFARSKNKSWRTNKSIETTCLKTLTTRYVNHTSRSNPRRPVPGSRNLIRWSTSPQTIKIQGRLPAYRSIPRMSGFSMFSPLLKIVIEVIIAVFIALSSFFVLSRSSYCLAFYHSNLAYSTLIFSFFPFFSLLPYLCILLFLFSFPHGLVWKEK